jgi:geranylgeranyl pyrophosphate synthase
MTLLESSPFLKQALPLIHTRLDALVPVESKTPSAEVLEAARYALLGPGKKLRPLLTLAVYSLFHDDVSPILNIACAIEMIHTYSLIHDDLPSLDNDDMRRGRPTVHKAFSESTAILAGDFLLTHAFGAAATAPFPSDILVKILAEMSHLSGGYHGMIAGQVIDLQSEGKELTERELERLHSLKTGALIELSVLSALIAAKASSADTSLLLKFARLYGLAFQVADDVVDVLRPEEKHGKAVSSDLSNHKATYVSLLGLDGAKNKAEALIEEAEECLALLEKDTSSLQDILMHLRLSM